MVEKYLRIIEDSFVGYFNYLINEIFTFSWHNYFWALVFISLFFYALELIKPWRKDQPKIRQDFWLDGFYMFFNFFICRKYFFCSQRDNKCFCLPTLSYGAFICERR